MFLASLRSHVRETFKGSETPRCSDPAIKSEAWPSVERSWPPASECNVTPSQPGDDGLSWTLPTSVVQVDKLLAPYKSSHSYEFFMAIAKQLGGKSKEPH